MSLRTRRVPARSGRSVLAESLEIRRFLSVSAYSVLSGSGDFSDAAVLIPATDAASPVTTSDVAHTQYQIYQTAGSALPFSSSPSGRSPSEIRKSYGVSSILFGGVSGDGTGQTVAIVDAYDDPSLVSSTSSNFSISDLHRFDVQYGIADPPSFIKMNQTGGSSYPVYDQGWAGEIALDVEWLHSIAPNASIILVEADSNSSDDLIAAVTHAKSIPGVIAISMSYGVGEDSLDPNTSTTYTTPVGHTGITFLASTGDGGAPGDTPSFLPNVVAVGGTRLTQADSTGTYSSESGWTDGGGGISLYESKPSYQSYFTTPSTTKRTIPDISMNADPDTGVSVLDTSTGGIGSAAQWWVVGGTSVSCPTWTGLVAIADQGRTRIGLTSLNGLTQTLPRLYTISSTDFHDVTTGNNGFAATTGYDLVTGRGTPKANLIIPDLAGGVTLTGTVFNDRNSNSILDAGDLGILGVTVYLDMNNNGAKDSSEPTATTNSSGVYSFTDLPGNAAYSVRQVLPAGYILVSSAAVSAASSYNTTKTANFADQLPQLVAHISGPFTVAEGSQITLSSSGTTGAITLYEWDTNYNGTTFNPVLTGASAIFSASAIDGPASRNIALRITSILGDTSLATSTISITNANPTASFSSFAVTEGANATVTLANPTDAATADRAGLLYSFDINNTGTFSTPTSTPSFPLNPSLTADGPASISVRGKITDKDGGSTTYTATITVTDAPPTATFAADTSSVPEGTSSDTVSFSNPADPSTADTTAGFTYSFDFFNNNTWTIPSSNPIGNVPASLLLDGPVTRTINGRIIDKDGISATYSTTITITDVSPTATLTYSPTGTETDPLTITLASPFDPSSSDTSAGFTYTFDIDNDGSLEANNQTSPSYTFLPTDNGAHTFRARITDRDGYTDYFGSFTLSNVSPTATFTAGASVTEGHTSTVTFSHPADSTADTAAGFTYSFDYFNNNTWTTPSTNPVGIIPASRLLDGPASYSIHARILDKDGASTDYTVLQSVTNIAPTLLTSVPATSSLTLGRTFSLPLHSTDPGTDTLSTWTVQWGDTTTTSHSTSPTLTHDYTHSGDFSITITATDEDGSYQLTRDLTVTEIPADATYTAGAISPSSFLFSVTYHDDLGINASTLDSSDIAITSPTGQPVAVSLVSSTSTPDNQGYVVTYNAANSYNNWTWQDDGSYSIALRENAVIDLQHDPVPADTLGSFSINLVAPETVDLVGQSLTSPKSLTPGTRYSSIVHVVNRGHTNLPATKLSTQLYLSTDTTLDRSDILLATNTNKYALLVNQYKSITFSFLAPKLSTSGTYYLLTQVDTTNAVSERDERANTTASLPITYNLPAPTLAASFSPTIRGTHTAGTSLAAVLKLTNTGSAALSNGQTDVSFLLSTDTTADSSDILLSTKHLTFSLKSKASKSFNLSLPIPASASGNILYLLVVFPPAKTASSGPFSLSPRIR